VNRGFLSGIFTLQPLSVNIFMDNFEAKLAEVRALRGSQPCGRCDRTVDHEPHRVFVRLDDDSWLERCRTCGEYWDAELGRMRSNRGRIKGRRVAGEQKRTPQSKPLSLQPVLDPSDAVVNLPLVPIGPGDPA
jgi:hypothetical protein